MSIQVALAGNPNCGKTTLFNGLTGATQYVGNWPGVTVEKKEGKYNNGALVTHAAFRVLLRNREEDHHDHQRYVDCRNR